MISKDLFTLSIAFNVSGAVQAALRNDIVLIVDLIDMSTTAEALIETGAVDIFGASPDRFLTTGIGNYINPERIAYIATKKALRKNKSLLLVVEPRTFSCEDEIKNMSQVLRGVSRAGGEIEEILPNIGADIINLVSGKDKIFIFITSSGGVTFDAAYNCGASDILTGTVVRNKRLKSKDVINKVINRVISRAKKLQKGITVIAASSNSYEDVIAAEEIANQIIKRDFLNN